jgi:hypothetical protein
MQRSPCDSATRTSGRFRYDASSVAKDALFIIAAAAYLGLVFQIGTSGFWNRGMGDWLDPYFVNYLLEHWFVSVTTVANPVSPPMFHPAPGALGYSVSLILYVPISIAFRFALHPFQAFNLTLFIVVFAGTVSLFVFLRRIVRVSVLEAVALTALFVTSPNVLNGWIGVWGQRASVFLIPPLLLMIAAAVRMREGLRRTALGGASGLCAALLFTHDFYTVVLASVVHAAAFREHPGFDHRQVFDQLVPFGTSPYLDLRPFLLAAALAGLTWIPWFRVDATTRRRATWLAIASAIVLMLPMRVADASLWTVLFHLPGVSAVRDPTRLVYFYQLALSLGIGVLLVRLAPNSWLRWATIALVAALVAGRARRGRPITSTRCTWRCARPSPLFSVTAHGRQRDGESAILPRPIIWTASIAGSPTTL